MLNQVTPSKEAEGQATQNAAAGADNKQTTQPQQTNTDPDAGNPTGFAETDDGAEEKVPTFSSYKSDDEEASAMSGININDFKARGNRAMPQPPAQKKEVKQVEQTQQTKPQAKARVYENLQPDEVEIFKGMSNKAYERLYPLYLEHKKLKPDHEAAVAELTKAKEQLEQVKGKVPASLYNHPKGYLLSQQYERLSNDSQVAHYIKQHWDTQLAKIRKGEEWTDLDIVDGKFKLTPGQAATTEHEIAVLQHSQAALQQYMGVQNKLETHITQFQAEQGTAAEQLKAAQQQYFPGYEKPEHPTAKMQQEIIKNLPAAYQDHPLASLFAIGISYAVMLQHELQAAKKEAEVAKGVKRDAQNPTSAQFQAGGASPQPMNGVTFSAFRDRGNRSR